MISQHVRNGYGKVLSQEVAGATGKTIADAAITDATTGSFDSQFMNMSKTGVSGTVYEMEDMGATKELTQAMMDTIANDVGRVLMLELLHGNCLLICEKEEHLNPYLDK
ncbi:hypothetical protein BSPWISOXPB_4325 [uncultured Gammaproteobacteria bacterium]|nr:hypothetical protein BSPWISOXPB_4325 [uncultured Gammaproteobacteria bacterium]